MRACHRLFHTLLLATGVRVPGQQLLHVQKPNDAEWIVWRVLRYATRWRLYTAAVFACLVTNTVYAAAAREDVLRVASDVGVCLQYGACVLYFSTDHFDRFADDTVCVVKADHLAAAGAFLTLASVAMGAVVDPIPPFEWWRLTSAVTDTMGRYVAFEGLACATVVLFEHVKVLRIASMMLEQRCWDAEQSADVATMLRDLIRIRGSLVITGEIMHSVYAASVLTCAGMLGVVVYETQTVGLAAVHVDAFRAAVLAIAGLTLAVFGVGVYLIQEEQEEIGFVVRGAEFADTFLARGDRAVATDTSTTLEWYVVCQLLQEEWFEVRVLGVPLHSGTTLKQLALTVASAIATYQTLRGGLAQP